MNHFARTALAVVLAVLVLRAAAVAHVRIVPAFVTAGSTTTLTFRCPTERDTTSTVKLVVQLPPEIAPSTVRVLPVAGWRGRVVDGTIVWEGGTIAPGAVGLFPVEIGPIPAGHPLPFKAVQTYGDGEVVRWIELREPGEPEPPYPAPVLDIR